MSTCISSHASAASWFYPPVTLTEDACEANASLDRILQFSHLLRRELFVWQYLFLQ